MLPNMELLKNKLKQKISKPVEMKQLPTSENEQEVAQDNNVIRELPEQEEKKKLEPSSGTSHSRGSFEIDNIRKISTISSNLSNQ